jgi:hypothetical protein
MSWSQQVFNYCERGQDPSIWAEPLNALSNGAFLVAALVAGRRLAALPPGTAIQRVERLWLGALAVLTAVIGLGSALFHTYATRWALIADVLPITLFMLAYLAYALRAFLGVGWPAIVLVLPAFLLTGSAAGRLACSAGDGTTAPCLNGSLGYGPALLALVLVGLLARARGPSGRTLLRAAGVFLVSLTLRTLDQAVCSETTVLGEPRGTHFFWHLLNGLTLYLLLAAAIARHELREVK